MNNLKIHSGAVEDVFFRNIKWSTVSRQICVMNFLCMIKKNVKISVEILNLF